MRLDAGDDEVRELAAKIEAALTLHATNEEKLFYPKLRERAEEETQVVDVFEAYTEHEVVKHLIALLKSGRKRDERFKAELQVLGESVKHHVREEESTIFSIAKKYLDSDERAELGEQWQKAKSRATSRANGKTASRNGAAAGTNGTASRANGRKTSTRKTSARKATTRKTR